MCLFIYCDIMFLEKERNAECIGKAAKKNLAFILILSLIKTVLQILF